MKRTVASLAALFVFAATACAGEIVFAGYNVRNYFRGSRANEGGRAGTAPKPEKEVAALVRVIKEINPDILGVCEMGLRADFADFQAQLKAAGLDYPESEYVEAADADRHLALLSKLPIVAHQSVLDASYSLDGRQEKVKRGFLDVTVKIADGETLRCVGVHLKSKLDVPEGQALIRRNEAHLLRQHLDGIMTENEKTKLLVYGDFNDTKNEPPIQEIHGPRDSPHYLADLWLKDSLGDRWTHYWNTADEYARIDFIFVNRALRPSVIAAKSFIYRSEFWDDASDHRPVVATIRTGK